jgi:hypothetical protein
VFAKIADPYIPSDNLYISTVNSANGGWLEIHNPTDQAISCKGLYLSNYGQDLRMWQMPSVIIRSGQTVRVRANSNNVDAVLKRMTTNFDIDVGSTIYLSDSSGQIISVFEVA